MSMAVPAHAGGEWPDKIPPEKIISDFASDGKAYLFILRFRNAYEPYEHDEIVCFVRPKGGL
jgi:hypothetical protein